MSTKLELLDPTHRGLHRFVPRHNDEIEIDIGDPVYVQKEAEDLWCEGKTNLFEMHSLWVFSMEKIRIGLRFDKLHHHCFLF